MFATILVRHAERPLLAVGQDAVLKNKRIVRYGFKVIGGELQLVQEEVGRREVVGGDHGASVLEDDWNVVMPRRTLSLPD